MVDASISVEREEHREDVLMEQAKQESKKDDSMPSFNVGVRLSQLDSQSPVLASTPLPDPNTAKEKDDDNKEDHDDAPLRFSLWDTTQANRDLSIKKSLKNRSTVGEKPTSRKHEVRKTTIKIKKVYCAVKQWLKSTISSC